LANIPNFRPPSASGIDPKAVSAKNVNTSYVFKSLWKYIRHYKYLLIAVIALNILSNLLALAGPVLTGKAVNTMANGKGTVDYRLLGIYCLLMLAMYLGSAVLSWIIQLIMVNITQRTVFDIRKDLFAKLLNLPVSYFDKRQKGDLLSRMSYDVDVLGSSLSTDIIQVSTSFIMVFGSFVMMMVISPVLVIIFAVILPLSILFVRKMTVFTRKLFRERQRTLGEINGYAEEMLTGQKTVKAFNHEETVMQTFKEINQRATTASYKAQYYSSSVMPTLNFANNLSFLLVTVFGVALVAMGKIDIGSVSSFILYSKKFSGPINELANIYSEIQSALAAGERVFLTLDETEETANDTVCGKLQNVNGEVEFKNVRFGYNPDKIIIKGLSFTAHKGQKVAIVGPTGAGKTTIVNLLMRFYDVDGGSICIDGVNIADVDRGELRRNFAMVLQDSWLFTGTVKENIAYGNSWATDEDIIAAAKAAKAHSFIKRLPQGYDTIITEDGTGISQGQKQLITIARAMLQNPAMLILDEATSSVDTRTEIQIQKAMARLMQGKTSFVIAHRLSTIKDADLILVMQNGEVAEQGTHEQLLAKGGFYSRLFNSQFEQS